MSTKHRLKVKDLRQTILNIRTHSFAYKPKEPNKTDFTRYNLAQINEITDVLEAIRETVDLADQRIKQRTIPTKGPGRPRVPAKDVLKVQLMETYFGVSDRLAEGFFNLFSEKLGISSDFCYKTIERGYDPERSKELIEEVLKITNEVGNANESSFSIDGTGDPCTMKINYESKRAEQRRDKQSRTKPGKQCSDLFPGRMHDFQYSVFTVGRSTKIIGGFETTDNHQVGEMSFFKPVVEQTIANCPSFEVLYGDGAYANRVACGLLAQQQITPYLLPMSTVTFRSKGVPLWKSMLYSLAENPQQWLESYHNRSMSESVNSMLKRRMAAKVRKKLSPRKAIAEALKFMDHEGQLQIDCFQKEGVNTDGIIHSPKGKSGVCLGFVDKKGARALYINPGVNDQIEFREIQPPYITDTQFLHLSSFVGEKSFRVQKKLMSFLPDSVKVSFDPGSLYAQKGISAIEPIIQNSFVMMPNSLELQLLTGETGIPEGAQKLIEMGVEIVAVKMGDKGCYVSNGEEKMTLQPYKVPAVDTTGAGDAFDAGFLYGLVHNRTLEDCGKLGNFVASRSVMKMGARDGLPTREDLTF